MRNELKQQMKLSSNNVIVAFNNFLTPRVHARKHLTLQYFRAKHTVRTLASGEDKWYDVRRLNPISGRRGGGEGCFHSPSGFSRIFPKRLELLLKFSDFSHNETGHVS